MLVFMSICVDIIYSLCKCLARTRTLINDSEARINKIIHEIKVDMKSEIRESESRLRDNFKSDLKASELQIIRKIDVITEKKVIP